MKEHITQLKMRWQNYSSRERNLFKLCAGALCCALVYYGAMVPLDNSIKSHQSILLKQKQTLRWMREEIDRNHLQARVLIASNPRNAVEESAKIIHLSLRDIHQNEQEMSFDIDQVNILELKNWLRQINITSGVHLERMTLQPVDHLSGVSAHITLSWAKPA